MATSAAVSKGAVMTIDEILPLIGEFGKYQIMVEIMFCVTIIPQTLQVLIAYFAALDPGWQCVANSTVCKLNGTISRSQGALYESRCEMEREEWIYAVPEDYSIVTQFDLSCQNQWLIQMATSVLFIGWGIGAIILGWLADKYGRRMVLFPSMFCMLVFGFLGTWAPNIELFIVSRAAVGFFIPGTAVQMFIMCSELVGPKKRPFAGIILWLFFTVGLVLLGIKAYFIRKWKTLFIVCTAPYFFVILFAKFIPESIRWQFVHGKIDDLMMTLKRIAEVNRKEFPEVTLAPLEQPSKVSRKSVSPLDLFRGRKIMTSTLSQGFGWFVNGMVYYGVALAADNLGGNLYRDYILASLVEFPAIIVAIDFCNRFGRKKTVAIPMFFGAIACVLVSVIPEGTSLTHWNALRVTLGMLGKFCITISFDSIYTWSVELNPTSVRAAAMGFLQVTSRAGAASAPWVVRSLRSVSIILPFALMGSATFASACLLLFLSETKDMKTRETLSDEDEDDSNIERGSLEEADKAQLISPLNKEKNANLATVV